MKAMESRLGENGSRSRRMPVVIWLLELALSWTDNGVEISDYAVRHESQKNVWSSLRGYEGLIRVRSISLDLFGAAKVRGPVFVQWYTTEYERLSERLKARAKEHVHHAVRGFLRTESWRSELRRLFSSCSWKTVELQERFEEQIVETRYLSEFIVAIIRSAEKPSMSWEEKKSMPESTGHELKRKHNDQCIVTIKGIQLLIKPIATCFARVAICISRSVQN